MIHHTRGKRHLGLWLSASLGLLIVAATTQAGVIYEDASSPAGNGAALAAWLTTVGIAEAEFFVDFESGVTDGQNLHGVSSLLPGGLVIWDTGPGTPAATVRGSATYFGGSNPIGLLAVAHDEAAYLELDFTARPVDYVSLYDIDHTGTDVVVTFVDDTTATYRLDGTGTGGNSAEFFGLWRNDQPRIQRLQLDAGGDGEWGIDNLRYGVVPEPVTLALLALGGLALFARRRRK